MAKEQSVKVQGQNLNSQAFLTVERESFAAKDGRTMWSYAVHGKGVNGKETKVDFIPIDNGGYEVLEMIFTIQPTAELHMRDEQMTDGSTGRIINYTIYEVANTDTDGDELCCRVKPARESDKNILSYLLKKLIRASGGNQ